MKSSTLAELRGRERRAPWVVLAALSVVLYWLVARGFPRPENQTGNLSQTERRAVLERCQNLRLSPGPPPEFASRSESDRFVPGTNTTLLRNAKIWTGALNGTEVVYGDVLLDKGIIKAIGYLPPRLVASLDTRTLVVRDVEGAWITPGLVDLHSHIGVNSVPSLKGSADGNSHKGPILPWLRSLDGLNTHDASYSLAISGGVTTAQVLPGSANNIGGQSFVIKLRPTSERSPSSKLVEPPYTLNGTDYDYSLRPRWRHMKHACGENPSRTYSNTRMDSAWAFREAYNEARKIKDAQDEYCSNAERGVWQGLAAWPEDLKWEALVDVLRGRVRLSVHCYEPVDFDAIVRLTNEFKFPVASFHHAGSAYLVPDLLKKTYGGAPTIALFASNFRKKREAYRGSEFGPRVLADNGISVVMKGSRSANTSVIRILKYVDGLQSDHPVINSRYLLNEAAVAYYHGLPANLALSSVTSVSAQAAGLGHRIGTIKPGYDADLVIWDSHPLSLGATPAQVFIDGVPQLKSPHVSVKPDAFQDLPKTPNFDAEAKQAVEYEGLPPLTSRRVQDVLLTNVKSVWSQQGENIFQIFIAEEGDGNFASVLVRGGRIECIETISDANCLPRDIAKRVDVINLEGGEILPGLTTFGAPIGTVEIRLEASTNDGVVFDLLQQGIPSIIGGNSSVIRAVDGLQFEGRNTLLAYRSGVTMAVTAPSGTGFWQGISTAFKTGAANALESGAIVQDVASFHVSIAKGGTASVSTEIAVLRNLLLSQDSAAPLRAVANGESPLVVDVDDSDIMASLVRLKAEVEARTGTPLRLTFAGATEAWRLAAEIGKANIGVILNPSRSFPRTWDQANFLSGPPVTYDTPLTTLIAHNVTVAIGVVDEFAARNTRFDIAWAALESSGRIGKEQALSLASTNLEKLLGVTVSQNQRDYVAWKGGDALGMASKVAAIFSADSGSVRLL